jgi:glycosyltransferase involved in cell wall biosynthesis
MYKLLFITDTNIGGRAGAEQHLETLLRNLNTKQYKAHVLQLAPTVPQKAGNIGQCTFSHLPTEKVLSLNGIRTIKTVIQLIRKEQYDCILSYFETSDIISFIASYFTNKKALISSRRDTGFRHSNKLKWLYKLLNKRFKVIIAASGAINDCLVADGVDKQKVKKIYNGVDLERFKNINRQSIRKELNIGDDVILLGMVANLTPVKNHHNVITCIRKLHDNGREIHLALAGDGPLRHELAELANSLEIKDYVHFIGRRKDIPNVLSGIDIFILASETEGLSNALLEAMAANKPVIATNVGGNPEVVVNGTTGYLIKPGNPDELYNAIELLLDSKDQIKIFGEAGFERVKNLFSIDAMVNEYIFAIENAISQ